MPRLRAKNDIDLLFPHDHGVVFKIRRIHELPEDYKELELIQERTDRLHPSGRLEVQDTVYLAVDRAGYQEYYEICAVTGMRA